MKKMQCERWDVENGMWNLKFGKFNVECEEKHVEWDAEWDGMIDEVESR